MDPLVANKLARLARDIPNAEPFLFSRDPSPQVIAGVRCLPWTEGLAALGI